MSVIIVVASITAEVILLLVFHQRFPFPHRAWLNTLKRKLIIQYKGCLPLSAYLIDTVSVTYNVVAALVLTTFVDPEFSTRHDMM